MIRRIVIVATLLVFLLSSSFAFAQELSNERFIRESKTLYAMFHHVSDSLVWIYTRISKGTGFFVSKDGWILTSGHGVDFDFPEAAEVWVKLDRMYDSPVFEATKIIKSPILDLMLVKIDYKPKTVLNKFIQPALYEEVWVFGFRGTTGKAPSHGYITWTVQSLALLQCTASVTFGNSGSPVINRDGEAVGVCVMRVSTVFDGLLIPSTLVTQFLEANNIKVTYKKR